MAIQTITGADTLIIFGRVINDLADDDVSAINFANSIAKGKTGKNKNTLYTKDETGNNATLTLRVMRGSSDDIFLQSKQISQNNDFTSFVLATGQLVKNLGDGQGTATQDIYNLSGGIFEKLNDAVTNVSGNTEQGVSVYHMWFATAARTQQ